MRLAARLAVIGQEKYIGTTRKSGGKHKWNGVVRIDEKSLSLPMSWKKGRLIFVNSMSDLFHEKVPVEFIKRVFATMNATRQHTYQILTKRGERLEDLSPQLNWAPNIWMGVSVENNAYLNRIKHLVRSDAHVKFLSLEPLLGPLERLNLTNIDWVIAGGESGPGARAMEAAWVRSIRDQCGRAGVAFHFKQWGGVNKKKAGRVLDGKMWDQWPNRKFDGEKHSREGTKAMVDEDGSPLKCCAELKRARRSESPAP
jgi:protein gp37